MTGAITNNHKVINVEHFFHRAPLVAASKRWKGGVEWSVTMFE